MVVNEYLSWRRRWSRMVPHADPPLRLDHAPDHAATHRTGRVAHRAGQAAAPAARRARAALLRGLSDQEIAEVLGCGAGTVRGYASRALAALRVEMRPVPVKEHS